MSKLNLEKIPLSTKSDKKASVKLFILFYCFLFLISPVASLNIRNQGMSLVKTVNAESNLEKEVIPTPWVEKPQLLEGKRKKISEVKKRKIEHKIKVKALNKKINIVTELIESRQRHHQMLVKNYNTLIGLSNENNSSLDHEIIVKQLLSSCKVIENLEIFKSDLEIKKVLI